MFVHMCVCVCVCNAQNRELSAALTHEHEVHFSLNDYTFMQQNAQHTTPTQQHKDRNIGALRVSGGMDYANKGSMYVCVCVCVCVRICVHMCMCVFAYVFFLVLLIIKKNWSNLMILFLSY